MSIEDNVLYMEDIKYLSELDLPWEKLKNKSIMITGATGLIGSCLIDTIMEHNKEYGLNCRVIAIGRNTEKLKNRFEKYLNNKLFEIGRAHV